MEKDSLQGEKGEFPFSFVAIPKMRKALWLRREHLKERKPTDEISLISLLFFINSN